MSADTTSTAASAPDRDHDRNVIRRFAPAAALAINPSLDERPDQPGRHPDVVEPTTAVRGSPVACAIAPPSVEPLFRRNEMPHGVDETACRLQPCEALDLDRRMADDAEQLL